MGPFEAIRVAFFQKYATFQGRASRSEYWYFYLFSCVVNVVLSIFAGKGEQTSFGVLAILFVFELLIIIPGLAVTARRLHDTNRSGWWMLISCVPVVGWVLYFVWVCTRGTLGTNRFGEDPVA